MRRFEAYGGFHPYPRQNSSRRNSGVLPRATEHLGGVDVLERNSRAVPPGGGPRVMDACEESNGLLTELGAQSPYSNRFHGQYR